jgi:hypothetical protein
VTGHVANPHGVLRAGSATLECEVVHQMMAGMQVSYYWEESPVAEHLKIAKVYDFLICPDTGCALVQKRDGRFDLSGQAGSSRRRT